MIARNDGMPDGMCHSHASHSEATIPIENDGKWHVAAVALLLLYTHDSSGDPTMDGKAIIVNPLDPDKPEIENEHRRKMNPNSLKNLKPFRDRKPSER